MGGNSESRCSVPRGFRCFPPLPLEWAAVLRRWNETRTACPAVLGAEHRDRNLGRVGVGRDAVLIAILGGLLDLDLTGARGDHRLVDALGAHGLHHLHPEP